MAKYKIRTVQEKEEIFKYYQAHSWKETAKKYRLSYATFVVWKRLVRNSKEPLSVALARKPKRHTVRESTVALVKKLHQQDPTLSLEQIRKLASRKQKISRTTVWHIVRGR